MQNRMAMQWQQKIRKEKKISQSNVILGENTKRFNKIQWQEKEDKHHPGLTIVHLRYMAKNVDGKWRFVVKVPNHNHPPSPTEVHPMHRYLDETQFEYFMKSQPWKEHPMQILFL